MQDQDQDQNNKTKNKNKSTVSKQIHLADLSFSKWTPLLIHSSDVTSTG